MDNSQKKQILDKILESSEFQGADRYQEILSFLTAATLGNRLIKESIVAAKIFGKDKEFNPTEDPTVRVYMSNLRKKLEHYYLTEGADDQYRLSIPKGHYYIKIVKSDKLGKKITKNFERIPYIILISLVVILSLIVLYLWNLLKISDSESTSLMTDPIWNEFVSTGNKPPLLVFGDYLFLYERATETEGEHFVRNPKINAPQDFTDLLKVNPNFINKYVLCDFTYLRPSITWSITELLPVLWHTPQKIYLKLASELKWEDLNNYNVVFIGSFKTLYILKKILKQIDIEYEFSPPSLRINSENDFSLDAIAGNNYQTDLSLIAKLKGPNQNVILLIIGFDEVGIIEAAKMAVNPNLLDLLVEEKLTDKIDDNPFFFKLLLEVEGINQTGFKSKFLYFDQFDQVK